MLCRHFVWLNGISTHEIHLDFSRVFSEMSAKNMWKTLSSDSLWKLLKIFLWTQENKYNCLKKFSAVYPNFERFVGLFKCEI